MSRPGPDLGFSSNAAVRGYGLVCLTALVVLLFALLQRGLGSWGFFPVLVGGVALAFRWRLAPLLLLGTLAAVLFVDLVQFQRWGRWGRWQQPGFSLDDLILCGAAFAYVAGSYRLLGLVKNIFPVDPRSSAQAGAVRQRRSGHLVSSGEIALFVLGGVFCAALAQVGWVWLTAEGADSGLVPESWPDEVLHLLLLVWLLGLALIVGRAFLAYLGWRRLTREEAALLMQDTVWYETRREQWRIHSWLEWARRRQRAREENT
jgi:hypothetical protein